MKQFLLSAFLIFLFIQCDTPSSTDEPNNNEEEELTQPELLTPSNGAEETEIELTLSWKKIRGATAYQIQLSKNEDFSDLQVDDAVEATTYDAQGLEHETTYYWKVMPVKKNKSGPWSEVWKFTTVASDAQPEEVSTTLVAPENGASAQPTELTLEWDGVAEAVEYKLQVATEDNFSNLFTDTLIESSTAVVSNLEYNSNYYWRVLPITAEDSGIWSETRHFITEEEITQNPEPPPSEIDIWVGAYFASWNHYAPPGGNWGNVPTDAIDWDAFTHLYYFALNARSDGSLSTIAAYENMSPDRINAIVSAGHEHNTPVLISIGGWGNYDGFSGAITPGSRQNFISNLTGLITTWGFDGIDLDMEPIRDSDLDNYKAFVRELRTALDEIDTPLLDRPLLTTATHWQPGMHAEIQDEFDQINLMTYDLSGAWEGWVSWHNSAVYDGGLTFPGLSRSLPSMHGDIQDFINAGVAKEKLGGGIDFYGYVWKGGTGTSTGGVTEPNQSWDSAPTVKDNVPYHQIMDDYFSPEFYHWDADAEAAYLGIDESGSNNDLFISYDDEQSIRSKFDYVQQEGIGGLIIWELSGGYRSDQPSGQKDVLLQEVKSSLQAY